MLQSKLFTKTKKQAPKGAETISHKFLARGDFIDQTAAGIYTFLPLGWRVYNKVENIIREEINNIGGQELFMPTLIPKKSWQETGRWEKIDPPLFKVKDRHEKEFGLGSTHEEVITDLVRKRISSYSELPVYLYQFQNKFRNEMRATGGLLRVREFIMKDLYSFDVSKKASMDFYEKVRQAYIKIFKRCGLEVVAVEADSGTIGGDLSHEFILFAETGEDKIVFCPACNYGANIEKAGQATECPNCKKKLEQKSGIEAGHCFHLGTKYSQAMKAEFIDKDGKKKPIIMGCYGIGLGRLIAAIIEVSHDDRGIIWPTGVAPFDVHLLSIGNSEKVIEQSKKVYQDLQKQGMDVLYDDRDKSPGEKFTEADLIGIPIRLVVSEKTLAKNSVEIKKRNEKEEKLVELKELLKYVK
ncbi:MAG: proline--tRNA ligase [Patescibacteria group bacterium]